MAKKRSKIRTGIIIGILALAAFGGWKLYETISGPAAETAQKVERAVKAVKQEVAR